MLSDFNENALYISVLLTELRYHLEIIFWCSLIIATVARIIVKARRLMVIGVIVIPHGVKVSSNPIIETIAKLIPMLRAILSMESISFFGNMAFIKLNPGRKSTNTIPRKFLTYTKGTAFSGIKKTITAVTIASEITSQNQ